ncbi:unnamed protein product [Nesidiocoris tenuis]|uniref:Uncharacterized protein n=1 Tax=Nesidiocoris tenuis TaxID=355587 RepID=A0A6H5HQT6_9HEMI|nr:unnamed protein product [Nesidiocoris tenuis]
MIKLCHTYVSKYGKYFESGSEGNLSRLKLECDTPFLSIQIERLEIENRGESSRDFTAYARHDDEN